MATGRLRVSVATPDGDVPEARGLAAWLTRSAPSKVRGEVGIALVSDGRMRTLNRVYRGSDEATDVLSFSHAPPDPPAARRRRVGATGSPGRVPGTRFSAPGSRPLGEIVIAKGVAARQAKRLGHSLATELRILGLHGLLHLLGYDHEVDDGEMARLESRLRRRAGLPGGLTERGGKATRTRRRRAGGRGRASGSR